MRKILYLVLMQTAALAQPQIVFGTAAKSEMAVTFDLKVAGLTGVSMAALQFSLPSPVSPVTMSFVNGPVVLAPAKDLSCAGNSTGRTMCVLAGINSNVLADGGMVTVTLATSSTSPQTISVNVLDLLGASLTAQPIAITPPPMVTLLLTSMCDLDNNGKVDVGDLAGAVRQVQGTTPCGTADIAGRGKCDVVDVQRIVVAAMGGACKVQ